MRPITVTSFVMLLVLSVSITGCGMTTQLAPTASPLPPTATLDPTNTFTPTAIPPTATPSMTTTPTWVFQPAGNLTCPILLYHHVADINPQKLYYISPADFKAELSLLHDWGYTTIPMSLLVKTITEGAELPLRPLVISFDDGNEDIYKNAFPIMKELGYTGIVYIISNSLNGKDALNVQEIDEMVAAGWEVGDHSLTHLNLVDNPGELWNQAVQSRMDLQQALNLPIDTFAYPYGAADETTMIKVKKYGYKAAVGLNGTSIQGPDNLYYLNRIVLDYTIDIDKFTSLMPWTGPIK